MARDHLRHCRLRPAAPATALSGNPSSANTSTFSGISPMSGISPADYSYVERGLRRFRSRFYNYTASAPPAVAVPRLSLPSVAVVLIQARLALPERPAAVHLLDVLPPTLARLFESPHRLIDLVPRSSRPRARCYHAVPTDQYLPLLRRLMPLNMIKLHWYQHDLSPVCRKHEMRNSIPK